MAKGGKGRKGGGGGGGGKTRKYSRDNKGRFAPTGTGATARGGRLLTAKGNKRKTQTIEAAGQKGVLAKPKGLKPGTIKAKPAATAKPAALKFVAEQSGRVRRAALGGGRTAVVRKDQAVIINAKGTPIMTRKGLPNITAGKKYAANPNARGPRLMGSGRSEALPSRDYLKTSRPTGTINKPKGLKPGAIKAKAAAKPAKKSRFTSSELAERKVRADQLKAIPKPTRRAERIGRVARRQDNRTGQVGSDIIRKGKSSSSQLIEDLAEGALLLKGDKTGQVAKSMQNTANKLRGRMAITAAGSPLGAYKRTRIKAAGRKGVLAKPKGLKPETIKAKAVASNRKAQLAAGAQRRNAQADRIDAKVKTLESQYRSKDAAFYTQGVKPAARDRMIAKSQQAAQLREQSAALRTKAANTERMASKIKDKPTKSKSSGGDARLERAIKNETAGSTQFRRNPKGYQKRITALTAQQVYKTGDFMAGLSVPQAAGKGFRLPRSQRVAASSAKPARATAKPAAAPKTKKTRTDEGAFGDRFKRAGKIGLKRSIKESDNLNNPTGKATFEKRFAATQQRQSQADRTAAAAKDFYSRFGSPMSFAQRPKLSTASGARFGVKKKPARKPRPMR